ncbi:MAG: hypothetical protein L6R38_004602 [Xanthoria sp. 2 TBL-2021]|nr:MAG: hypothetical protein L6R38_004602 [Xanthoria sp. 2 TBL-2021]
MANSGPFEIPSSFWDQFTDLSGLDDCATFIPTESEDGTTPSKSNIHSEPEASTGPGQPYLAGSSDAQGVQSDGLQAGECPPGFEHFSDLLDEFWNNLKNGPSLADLETLPQESHLGTFSNALGSNDLGHPPPIVDNVSYAAIPAEYGAYQSPQPAISPAPQVSSAKVPVTTSFGGPQLANWKSQDPAPTAMMCQSPYTSEWTAANQAVHQEPKAAVMPTPRSHKRKAVEFDDSVDLSTGMLAAKRQKVQLPSRTIRPKKAVNIRTEIIQTFDGSRVYDPLPHRPRNWSIFRYTPDGELEPGTLYTPAQIQYYLYRHPLQTFSDGSKALKQGRLRLWIQRNPSDSKRRYPDPLQSNRCRFKRCFATHNVINQGHLRLCFDEYWHLNNENFHTDPFKNAGYVHLNCLERFLDFPQLCHDLPILLDDRDMPLEPDCRNLMSLAPRHFKGRNLYDVASGFLHECNIETLVGYPRGARPHPGTFVWRLMLAKVGSLYRLGDMKESHAEVHLGDLEVEFAGRNLTRQPQHQQGRTECGQFVGRARRGVVESDDDGEEST